MYFGLTFLQVKFQVFYIAGQEFLLKLMSKLSCKYMLLNDISIIYSNLLFIYTIVFWQKLELEMVWDICDIISRCLPLGGSCGTELQEREQTLLLLQSSLSLPMCMCLYAYCLPFSSPVIQETVMTEAIHSFPTNSRKRLLFPKSDHLSSFCIMPADYYVPLQT